MSEAKKNTGPTPEEQANARIVQKKHWGRNRETLEWELWHEETDASIVKTRNGSNVLLDLDTKLNKAYSPLEQGKYLAIDSNGAVVPINPYRQNIFTTTAQLDATVGAITPVEISTMTAVALEAEPSINDEVLDRNGTSGRISVINDTQALVKTLTIQQATYFGVIGGSPYDNSLLKEALASKLDKTTVGQTIIKDITFIDIGENPALVKTIADTETTFATEREIMSIVSPDGSVGIVKNDSKLELKAELPKGYVIRGGTF